MQATIGVELTVLGAGPAYTNRPGATGAAYLVRGDDSAVLLDLGQGSLPRLFSVMPPEALDLVVISHLHPDHFIDLVPLRHYLRWEFRPSRRVRVAGPAQLVNRLDALHDERGFAAASLDVSPLTERPCAAGGLVVEPRLVTHTAESYAFRVTRASAGDGPGLVYSGDCGRADDLLPLLRPGDTLLSEVAFGPGPVAPGAMHLDGPAVGRVAAAAGAASVLLTHLQMGFDPDETEASVRRAYEGPVRFVWPGDRLTV